MTAWLLKILGISDEITSHLDNVSWVWARPSWLLAGLVLLVPAAYFIWRRQEKNLPHVSPRPRRALSVCRIGVLFLLVIVLGGPYLRLDEKLEQKPILAMLMDESGSMSLPAGPFTVADLPQAAYGAGLTELDSEGKFAPVNETAGKALQTMSRADLLTSAINARRATTLKTLNEKYDLRYYRVARRVRRVELDEKDPKPPGAFDLSESSLGAAIEEAVNEAAGRPIAGLLLMSDGRNTTGPAPLSVVRRFSGGESRDPSAAPPVPVFAVPVGSSEVAPDIVLLDLFAPADVAKEDTVAITATIGSHGFDKQEVEVTLRDGETVLDTKKLTLTGEKRQQVQLSFTAKQPGAKVLTASVAPRTEEQVRDNNEQSVAIRVDTDKLRVLLLEGTPRWDFRFLDHALRRDRGLDVRFVMESQLLAGGTKPEDLVKAGQIPATVAEFADFHVVMLGDVSPAMLPLPVQEALAKAVEEEGVGLIVHSGTQQMPHVFVNAPLGKLLPMKVEPRDNVSAEPGQPTGGMDAPPFKPFKMHVTANGSMHPAFALYPDASRNRTVWSQMPTFFWAAKTGEISPGATLLAEVETESGKKPIIAEQFVGRGRVFMLGGDETFRWRRNIGDQLFYRFWGQAIRHVARKKVRSDQGNWIEASPKHVEPGSPVAVELFAVNPSGQPLNDASVAVGVTGGPEEKQILLAKGPQPGHYRAVWSADAPGMYTFSFAGHDGELVTTTVRAADSGRERRNPTVDRDALGALADASGGRMVELHELPKLPEMLKGEAVTVDRRHEEEIWDNWLTIVLLAGLYCTDVGIRRLLGLT